MTEHQVTVRVHRRGKNPEVSAKPETATVGPDGFLYVRHGGRWWRLSNGLAGWRSLNVAPCDPMLDKILNERSV